MTDEFPDMSYIENVCKIGQGAACCRYLVMSPEGFECAKYLGGSLKRTLDDRVLNNSIVARGDNCEGKSR